MDMILVGDTLGMCVYGYDGTAPVTMDQCITHCDAVRRGAPDTYVIGDMPFLSYQTSDEDALANAGRFLKEAGVEAIKLEGGKRMIRQFQAFTPKFVKKYADVADVIKTAMRVYVSDVKTKTFPADEHCYHMLKGEEIKFKDLIKEYE